MIIMTNLFLGIGNMVYNIEVYRSVKIIFISKIFLSVNKTFGHFWIIRYLNNHEIYVSLFQGGN